MKRYWLKPQPQPLPQRRLASGLSLTECLMVLALLAVMGALALPNLRPLMQRARVNVACSEFHQSILVARSEAIRRRVRVDIVPVVAGEWRHGWLVLIDENNNQRHDPGELLIHRSEADLAGVSVEARLRDASRAHLAFGPGGRPRSATSANVPQVGSLVFSAGSARRKLIISFLGRVRVCDPEPGASAC